MQCNQIMERCHFTIYRIRESRTIFYNIYIGNSHAGANKNHVDTTILSIRSGELQPAYGSPGELEPAYGLSYSNRDGTLV